MKNALDNTESKINNLRKEAQKGVYVFATVCVRACMWICDVDHEISVLIMQDRTWETYFILT
jgi:hypothetical protein